MEGKMLLLVAATRQKQRPDGTYEQIPMADHFNPDGEFDLEMPQDKKRLFADFEAKYAQGPWASDGWKLVYGVRFSPMSHEYCHAISKLADPKKIEKVPVNSFHIVL
jgi:hypothetical protein